MKNQNDLAIALKDFVITQLEDIERRYFPALQLPVLFAGHPMGADVSGDLVYVLGMLHELGYSRVAGLNIPELISAVLGKIDGEATHSFYSYRVAETLLRFGRFADNPLLQDLPDDVHLNIAAACDSTAMISSLGSQLPRNYVAVLARCETARKRLGLAVSDQQLDELLIGTRSLMSADSLGFIDDSNTGDGRYDIYSADIYLFTEPFADSLGELWPRGIRNVLKLVEQTLTSDGTAIPWGRSTGALGLCITAELAAMALSRDLTPHPGHWLKYVINAAQRFESWFHEGLISAHQYRSTFAYRGPHRRVQMTLDSLGKLLQVVIEIEKIQNPITPASGDLHASLNELLPLSSVNTASVWSYRSADQRFVLPLVGSVGSDYLPVPRNPGLLEYPVDSDLATGVAVVSRNGVRYVPGMLPDAVSLQEDGLHVSWQQLWPLSRRIESKEAPLQAAVDCLYRVDGPTIHLRETLSLETLPEGITIQFTEIKGRPLKIEFDSDHPHQCSRVSVLGLKEYRSFWSELSEVHQMDIRPDVNRSTNKITLSVSISPKIRMCNTIGNHHYQRSLYDPIADDVVDELFPRRCWRDLGAAAAYLETVDQFHLHWPEHFLGTDLAAHKRMIDCIRQSGVRVIWTQHNLLPHDPGLRENAQAIYQLWAEAAQAIVHHSESGRKRVMDRFRFNPDALHLTMRHGHFGNLMQDVSGFDRAEIETELGLKSCAIRIGIVGAPRIEKKVQRFIDAFAASDRDDLQLFVTSLRGDESVPDDPRITTLPYRMVDRVTYNRRLAVIDVLAFPILPGDLLTTGVIGDAIGLGLPGLITSWDFLSESLQNAGLHMGDSSAEMTRAIESLNRKQIEAGARAARSLQHDYDWRVIAGEFLTMLRQLGSNRL